MQKGRYRFPAAAYSVDNSGKWNTPALQLLIDAYGDSADRQLGRLLWKVLREDSEMYDFKPIYRGTEYTWL